MITPTIYSETKVIRKTLLFEKHIEIRPSPLSPQWICGNSWTLANDVGLAHLTQINYTHILEIHKLLKSLNKKYTKTRLTRDITNSTHISNTNEQKTKRPTTSNKGHADAQIIRRIEDLSTSRRE